MTRHYSNMAFISFDSEMKERFGGKVYRLSLSTGCTCPNRDGKCGTGGCIFCSAGGSGEFAEAAVLPVEIQIEKAKEKVAGKLSRNFAGYLAYFQSFTNTYIHDAGELEKLRKMFMTAIGHREILGLSIATRPDCLDDAVMEMLSELNRIKPVWVELGLQTCNDGTAAYINRGYKTEVYDEAVDRLHKEGIAVITHVIIGLPGEDENMAAETLRHVIDKSEQRGDKIIRDGVKLTLLYVLKGTRLEKMISEGMAVIREYSLEEYAGVLKKLLMMIPTDMTVHRITGDPPKALLISPKWTADKKKTLNYLRKYAYQDQT